jgi:hypothetical protein
MKNYELLNLRDRLQSISQLPNEFSVSVGYKILKNINKVNSALAEYQEMQNRIVKKYAKEGETSIQVKEDDPRYNDIKNDMEELLQQECDDIEFQKISIHDIENEKLTLKDLANFSCMLDDESEDK